MTKALVVATIVLASGGAALVNAQTRGGVPQPVSDALRASWDGAKKNVRETANVVPEANFSYSPVPGTVRTLGQIIGHVAGANYVFCAAAKGEKSVYGEEAFEKLATKAALVKVLEDSLKYCDAVFAGITDRSAGEPIEMPFGMGKGARAAALLGNIGHLNEHYGNLVTYMRMKGIVPPSSRR